MIEFVVAAPFAFAIAVRLIPQRSARRFARIVLAFVAALLPVATFGSIDRLSMLFASLVSVLGLLATLFSSAVLADDWTKGYAIWSRKPVYFVMLGAFWSSMLLVVLASNFALLWLGVALTTLATAFLVGYSGEAAALEAAWKYLVLCSVGIAFALLGLIVLAHVAIAEGIGPVGALSWGAIAAHGSANASTLARVAVALMIVGFATKAGLVPLHAWLPDAHSKAPAPISALLSGVLVSCALYALARTLTIAAVLGVGSFADQLLLWMGALSIAVAGALMLVQRDLKRLLAYSTIEHAGIVALALGFGTTLGWFAALFHLTVHAFAKSSAFFSAGMVQRDRGSTEIARLHGLWNDGSPGRLLLAALAALAGMPPFGLFVTELLVVFAGIAAGRWIPLSLALVGLLLAFAALARATIDIEGGAEASISSQERLVVSFTRLHRRAAVATVAIALTCCLALGIVPWTGLGR